MSAARTFHRFAHQGANFRIACEHVDVVRREIVRQRRLLEEYLAGHEEFGVSLEPVAARADAPKVAQRMAVAAAIVGVGPMAAVAGAMAQLAAEAALDAGSDEALVENGGDIFLICRRAVVVALHAGSGSLADSLALSVEPDQTPLAICSSSGRMGHSMSLGDCDLATVTASDASLADAAATLAANLVRTGDDIDGALERVVALEGVGGVLIVQAGRVGLAGRLPRLVRHDDEGVAGKVTRDPRSG